MESTQRKTAAPSNEPDAELLRLNAEYRIFLGELNAGKHRNPNGDVSDEARERMFSFEQKIADTPAESYAGIAIKLLIAVDNLLMFAALRQSKDSRKFLGRAPNKNSLLLKKHK